MEVHALLRPAARRARTRVRAGVPDAVDPVRPARRATRARARAGRASCRPRAWSRPASTATTPPTASGRRRVLPPARRARGVRAAARSGGDDARPTGDVAAAAAAAACRTRRPGCRRCSRGGGGESRAAARAPVVPDVELRTYYDRPVLKEPVWKCGDPGLLLHGGLAAGARRCSRPRPIWRVTASLAVPDASNRAVAATGLSSVLLVADLGRPTRFHHMLRVFKPTSPMNVGSWLLGAYGPDRRHRRDRGSSSWPVRPWSCRAAASRRRRARAAARDLHRGAHRRHRHPGVARRAGRAAVRLRGRCGRERSRAGHPARAGRRAGPRPCTPRRRCGVGAHGGTAHGAQARSDRRRGRVPSGPRRQARPWREGCDDRRHGAGPRRVADVSHRPWVPCSCSPVRPSSASPSSRRAARRRAIPPRSSARNGLASRASAPRTPLEVRGQHAGRRAVAPSGTRAAFCRNEGRDYCLSCAIPAVECPSR